MTRYAIAVDCNRCVGCMACNGACKMVNNVPIGSFWNKVLRIGPNEPGQDEVPSHDFYFLPIQCQHCEYPDCVMCAPRAPAISCLMVRCRLTRTSALAASSAP